MGVGRGTQGKWIPEGAVNAEANIGLEAEKPS